VSIKNELYWCFRRQCQNSIVHNLRYKKNLKLLIGSNNVVDPDPDQIGLADQDLYPIQPYRTVRKAEKYFFPKISIYCQNIENYDTYGAEEKDKNNVNWRYCKSK